MQRVSATSVGGAVASWLARSFPDRAVRVRALPGTLCCVLGQDTLHTQCLSPPRCINTGEFNAGGNPAIDQHLIQGE